MVFSLFAALAAGLISGAAPAGAKGSCSLAPAAEDSCSTARAAGTLSELRDAPSRPRPRLGGETRAEALEKLRTQPASELFAFASFGDARAQENLGESANFNGSTTRLASLNLDVPPQVAVLAYRDALASGGNPAWGGPLTTGAYYLAFRDQHDGLLRTLTVIEQGSGSLVLAAVSDLSDETSQVTRAPVLPDGFPMLPMKGEPTDFQIDDGPMVQLSRSVKVVAENAGVAVEFFVRGLGDRGWMVEPESVVRSELRSLVVMSRGEERCSVTATREPNAPPGEVDLSLLCLTRRER